MGKVDLLFDTDLTSFERKHGIKVVGYRPRDERWERMNAIYVACQEGDIPIPQEVAMYFGARAPGACIGDEVEVNILRAIRDASYDGADVLAIDPLRLPKDISWISIYGL